MSRLGPLVGKKGRIAGGRGAGAGRGRPSVVVKWHTHVLAIGNRLDERQNGSPEVTRLISLVDKCSL